MGFRVDGMIMLVVALLPCWLYFNFDNLPVQAKQAMPPFLRNKSFFLGTSIFLACFGTFQLVYGN
jgi:hypothetical protein